MDNRAIFWNSLVMWKYDLLCVEYAYRNAVKRSRGIKVFAAFLSSGAFATWVLWDSFPKLLAALIVLAGLLNVVYEYTPYSKRISTFSSVANKLDEVYCRAEADWLLIANGDFSEVAALALRYKYASEVASIRRFGLQEDAVALPKKVTDFISQEVSQYFFNLNGESDENADAADTK